MPQFQYKGRNRQGEAMRGRLEAEQLFNSGTTPIEIHRLEEEKEKRERLLPLIHLRGSPSTGSSCWRASFTPCCGPGYPSSRASPA